MHNPLTGPSWRMLVLATAGLALCLDPLDAQAVDLERRAYARFETLRTALLRRCLEADPEPRRAVAAVLADEGIRHPFESLAAAWAAVGGVEDDDLLRYRTGTTALVLPAAVDQDRFQQVHVTGHAPRIVPDVGPVRFVAWIEDAEGERLRELEITERTAVEDVLRVRATGQLPTAGLEPGSYVVGFEAWIDGQGPRPWDPGFRTPLAIVPGFAARAERLPLARPASEETAARAMQRLGEIPLDRRDPASLALLYGATDRVERIYAGRPRLPQTDPVQALVTAERILENLSADAAPLRGLVGRVTVGLPAPDRDGSSTLTFASLELPAADARQTPRPLVVFVPGAPSWDARASRPQAPQAVAPEWLHERLSVAGFDAGQDLQSVVLESPGRLRLPAEALLQATATLQELLPWTAAQPVVWVGEREGCYAVQRALGDAPGSVRGAVFVAGAGPTADRVDEFPGVRFLAVPAQGHPSTGFLQHVAEAVGDPQRYRCTDPDGIAWPLAVPLQAIAIEEFVRQVCED